MQKWYQIFHKNTGLNPYVWVVFYILPFYFIFRSSSTPQVIIGIAMILVFFACYVLAFVSRGWLIYFWTSVQILISITMTLLFGYVYFSLFLAFFIGHIQNRVGFFTLYSVHLITTFVTINYGFATRDPLFVSQLPFVLLSLIAVILLPVNLYNKNRQDKLEVQLEDAHKRISDLSKLEERQRIARDLHDTLGQKLSLIGLKSDLAKKLMSKNPVRAQAELSDIRQTARSALKEVREMVTQMRGARVEEEILRVRQILLAAGIELQIIGDSRLSHTPLMTENVLSMCIKEAVTNIVKHSNATSCCIVFEQSATELILSVKDDGSGPEHLSEFSKGNGLRGMKERLEFVNGSLEIRFNQGTTLVMKVPNSHRQPEQEAEG